LGLKHGIRVNTVQPGPIETDLLPPETEPQLIKFKANRRLENWGKPADVANTVLFLASKMGNHIQGQVINVDGGILY
jgi:3-oxoacyl-[acyl-carrier protein] reductase